MTLIPETLPLALTHFANAVVQVDAPVEVAVTPRGRRRVIAITGGEVRGADWSARVLPGGADYQRIVADTRAELEAHYVLETPEGGRIYVRNQAIRVASAEVTAKLVRGEPVDPALVYFRCVPTFETDVPALAWINDRVFVGTGLRRPDRVVMSFYVLA